MWLFVYLRLDWTSCCIKAMSPLNPWQNGNEATKIWVIEIYTSWASFFFASKTGHARIFFLCFLLLQFWVHSNSPRGAIFSLCAWKSIDAGRQQLFTRQHSCIIVAIFCATMVHHAQNAALVFHTHLESKTQLLAFASFPCLGHKKWCYCLRS